MQYKFTLQWRQLMMSKWVECKLDVATLDQEWFEEMVVHTDHEGIRITPYREEY